MTAPHLLGSEEGQGRQCPEAPLLAVWVALKAGQVHGIHVGDGAACHREKMGSQDPSLLPLTFPPGTN